MEFATKHFVEFEPLQYHARWGTCNGLVYFNKSLFAVVYPLGT
jgi:hypothetical protein